MPEPKVLSWLEAQAMHELFTTAISRGEMLYVAHLLPSGRRRESLLREMEGIFSTDMAERVLSYDGAAADAYAEILSMRRRHGRSTSQSDAMIAGIVRSRSATLATRYVRDFDDCGLALIDPWH